MSDYENTPTKGIESYWDAHPDYSPEDWQYEVANGDCRRGYWAWVRSQIEAEEDE